MTGARRALAASSFGLAVALAAYPLRSGAEAVVVILAGVALGFQALGLSALWPAALLLATACLGLELTTALLLRGEGLDLLAPFFGAGLFAASELGWASLEPAAGAGTVRPLATVLLLAGAGAAAGWALLALAALPLPGGEALTAVGVVAVMVAAAALAWLGLTARSGASRSMD
ncbi:MAG: hypothetical protein M3024_06425 [Candidatus Dormibacteraeota bacterium]|nr:hypothetical protein [Candidatus Dormibacteraeota bacterium]